MDFNEPPKSGGLLCACSSTSCSVILSPLVIGARKQEQISIVQISLALQLNYFIFLITTVFSPNPSVSSLMNIAIPTAELQSSMPHTTTTPNLTATTIPSNNYAFYYYIIGGSILLVLVVLISVTILIPLLLYIRKSHGLKCNLSYNSQSDFKETSHMEICSTEPVQRNESGLHCLSSLDNVSTTNEVSSLSHTSNINRDRLQEDIFTSDSSNQHLHREQMAAEAEAHTSSGKACIYV